MPLLPEQLNPKKWVRDPIGERERAIHPFGVALTQRNTMPTAPFDAALLRAQADAWLADICSPNPSAFAWRVAELARVERQVVGRTPRSFAEEVRRPRRRGAPTLNRLQLRVESELLSEVAQALQDPSRVISPRAVVRSRRLITECGSPLNCSARHDELQQALKSILADISSHGATGEHEPQGSQRRRAAFTPHTSRTCRMPTRQAFQ
jgi:hypothetical protein